MAGGGGQEGSWSLQFFEIVEFSEILICRKIFLLLLLVKIRVLNFIPNSLNLAFYSICATM